MRGHHRLPITENLALVDNAFYIDNFMRYCLTATNFSKSQNGDVIVFKGKGKGKGRGKGGVYRFLFSGVGFGRLAVFVFSFGKVPN